MLRIRFVREGRKRQSHFGLVVAEHSFAVQGRYVERLGFYNPRTKEIQLEQEKIMDWIKKGAQPTTSVARLLKSKDMKGMEKFIKFVQFPEKVKEEVVEKETPAPAPAPAAETVEAPVEEAPVAEEAPAPEAEEKETIAE